MLCAIWIYLSLYRCRILSHCYQYVVPSSSVTLHCGLSVMSPVSFLHRGLVLQICFRHIIVKLISTIRAISESTQCFETSFNFTNGNINLYKQQSLFCIASVLSRRAVLWRNKSIDALIADLCKGETFTAKCAQRAIAIEFILSCLKTIMLKQNSEVPS